MRIIKMSHGDMKLANAVEKMAPIDLLSAGLPQTLSSLKMQYLFEKCNNVKYNKMKYACNIYFSTKTHSYMSTIKRLEPESKSYPLLLHMSLNTKL